MPDDDNARGDTWVPADVGAFEASASGELPALTAVNDDVIEQFRANDGSIVNGAFTGMPGLLLHTAGARTGALRVTPLYRFDYGGHWYVIGAAGGSAKTPAWVHNLRTVSQTAVEVGSTIGTGTCAVDVRVRELSEPERGLIWGELRREIPHIDGFQANTQRVIPIFELSRMTGDDAAQAHLATST